MCKAVALAAGPGAAGRAPVSEAATRGVHRFTRLIYQVPRDTMQVPPLPSGSYSLVRKRNAAMILRRIVWRFLKKLKLELPYDPAIPLLGIYPEKTIIPKDTCTPMFTAALFTITRT